MREMEHVTGAAAPGADRLVSARERLDAAWVIVVAALLIASAFLPLIDLPTAALQTIDAPLRVYPFVLPASAIIAAVASVVTRSSTFGAVATGLLVPSIALIGSISVSIFLDESSAFADGGVALSLFAAGVGVVMTVRWFVYHPAPLLGDIVLARETVQREAAAKRIDPLNHISHLLIHGFLHLQGFDHENERDATEMEALEIKALARLSIDNPYQIKEQSKS